MGRRAFVLVILAALTWAGGTQAAWLGLLDRLASPASTPGAGALFLVHGHGWGHGVGLSQYGAYGYAQHGWAWQRIVGHYFPGTTLGPAPVAKVRVLLAEGASAVTISSAMPFKVRDAGGNLREPANSTVTLGPGLRLLTKPAPAAAGAIAVTQPAKPKLEALQGPLTFVSGGAPLKFGHQYRGSLEVSVVNGRLRVVNVVGLEQYLYGVVPSEMPWSWAPEALKAQAVVARSYALAVRRGGPFDLYADTRSQVYLGVEHERPTTTAAVDATAGQVVMYGGRVATTYFFSTSGGRTASVADVWGGSQPYLVSVADPYDSISPYHDWGPFAFSGSKLGQALHFGGAVTDIVPTLNASGRVASLTVFGGNKQATISATDARHLLGLRSTWFSIGVLSLTPPAATTVEYGTSVQLTGTARGVQPVTLEERPATTLWETLGALTPAKDGSLSIVERPTITTDYRLAAGTLAAGAVRVAVFPRIRFGEQHQPGALSGIVRPVLPGASVQIQRQTATGWRVVAAATVDPTGSFTAQVHLVTGTYRAKVAPGHGFVAGLTPLLRVVSQ